LTSFPVIKELVVSAGNSVQITLPKNEVQLNAFVLPEPDAGKNPLNLFSVFIYNDIYIHLFILKVL